VRVGRRAGAWASGMDVAAFLEAIRSSPQYQGQIVYLHEAEARGARFGDPAQPLMEPVATMLRARGIARLYSHQAEAIDHLRAGRNVLVATGTASGKSLCYLLPLLELLHVQGSNRALLLFPTKALCQDQFRAFTEAAQAAGLGKVVAGVYDGDTPAATRRKLRDRASVIFTNPDMLHAGLMPQHARWAEFLGHLKLLVIDEIHVYTGLFGSSAANLFARFFRLCQHYHSGTVPGLPRALLPLSGPAEQSGGCPRMVACSATIGNPLELAQRLTGEPFALVEEDGSPRGRRTYVLWNPPRLRATDYRSRRSANVEAHELMAALILRGVPTIAFSKAKMTAEMIHRYVTETLAAAAPQLAAKVAPYRGGYLPEERRAIERRLFRGELLGVSATKALELGIDVGGLEASIIVGYPGTLASFFQQAGRAGRTDADSLVVLVGLDTSVNQYVMSHPEYLFGRPIERAALDPHNPFVLTGHLRCAAHELPLAPEELPRFGPHAAAALEVLQENKKVTRIGERWYHAATEIPQHEVSLRSYCDRTVLIQDADSGAVLGQMSKFDAPPILHPEAIYMHLGDTYRVLDLDLDRGLATVKRVEVDYYTQPLGGTDVHHVDHQLRERGLGAGKAYWGEVTAHFRNHAYEKVHFYSLDAISVHGLDLPTLQLETMAFWIVPPEEHMEQVRRAGLDTHSGLRAIGYATRMLLPLFITCDTLDFSHTVGSVNSPWNAVFVYERYPLGLGFTEQAYERMHEILPSVLDTIRHCPCEAGCPCCVGKPLRGYTTWNVERGEASIPSKAAAQMILELLLGDGPALQPAPAAEAEGERLRLERALRRRLERMREPELFHPITPKPQTEYPQPETREGLATPDVATRAERRRNFDRELRKRLGKRLPEEGLRPLAGGAGPPPGMSRPRPNLPPTAFPGKPQVKEPEEQQPVRHGDPLAARARRRKRKERGEQS
jgi:DEAD/DEAH box helicase domain-containing protein